MSDEPKKPIEELLESSARARRAEFGADPKMPNPMRARLHAEIASVARESEPETRSHRFGTWWPRIAIGAAMAALVIGAPIMWWQSRQSAGDGVRLAMDQMTEAKALNEAAVAPLSVQSAPGAQPEQEKIFAESAPATATSESFADSNGASGGTKSLDDLAKGTEESSSALKKFADVVIAPRSEPADTKNFGADEKSKAELRAQLLAEQKEHLASGASKVDQAPAAPVISEFAKEASRPPIADSGSLGQERKAENFRQQFSQTSANQAFRRDVKLQQAANVLNNFQVERDGRQIRVVDADGSTYTGKIERLSQSDARNLEKQNYAARSSKVTVAVPAKDADESANNEFYFRATGYSGSLKKSLVFEGNYIVTASPQEAKLRDTAASRSDEQMPARIVGTARIHGEQPVPVEAISVSPK